MNRKKKKETVIAVMTIVILFFVILLGGIRYRILGSSSGIVEEKSDIHSDVQNETDLENLSAVDEDISENFGFDDQPDAEIDTNPVIHSVTDNRETKLVYSFAGEQMQQEVEKLVENYYTNQGKEELHSFVLQTVQEQYGDSLNSINSTILPDITGQLQLATGDINQLKTLLGTVSKEYGSDKASFNTLIQTLSDRIASVEETRASSAALWELKEELSNLSSLLNNYMITVDESLNGITLYVEEGDLFGSWTDEEGNLISKKLDFAQ